MNCTLCLLELACSTLSDDEQHVILERCILEKGAAMVVVVVVGWILSMPRESMALGLASIWSNDDQN